MKNEVEEMGKRMTEEQIRTHLSAGGQLWRRGGLDRFFYKLRGDQLLCRVNEIGGWNPTSDDIKRLTHDLLHVAVEDYDYKDNKLITNWCSAYAGEIQA